MSKAEVRLQHVANATVGVTGAVYFVMRYLLQAEDAFGHVSHPLEPLVQHLHILFAPILVFATGLFWSRHIWPKWAMPHEQRRWSGVIMAAGFVPMVASGYLLQISVESAWRTIFGWLHVATGVLWVVGYVVHLVAKYLRRVAA